MASPVDSGGAGTPAPPERVFRGRWKRRKRASSGPSPSTSAAPLPDPFVFAVDKPRGKTSHDVVARVRRALSRSLVQPLAEQDQLYVVTLSADVENELLQLLAPGPDDRPLPADPRTTQSIVHRVANAVRASSGRAQPAVLCPSTESRFLLRRLTQNALPTVPFLSVHEIPDGVRVQAVGQVT